MSWVKSRVCFWSGIAFLGLGIGPLCIAEALHKFGLDAVDFGLMWGLTFGWVFALIGSALLIIGGISWMIRDSSVQ